MAKLTQKTERLITVEIFEADIRDMVQAYLANRTDVPRDANIDFEVSADGRAALTKITVQWGESESSLPEVF